MFEQWLQQQIAPGTLPRTITQCEYSIRAGKARRAAHARAALTVNSVAFNPHNPRHAHLAASVLRHAYRAALRGPS